MRVLQIPAIPLDRMWGHGPVPPLEGALELLHEQAAWAACAQRYPVHMQPTGPFTAPGALCIVPERSTLAVWMPRRGCDGALLPA